ncbi:MAG: hemerythrin domain-containing protein [Angustibacter sp.]
MSDAATDRAKAAQLPEGDVIRILLEQHARIRDLFAEVQGESGEHRQHAFDELRALLAVHETAEEMVLRPVSKDVAGAAVVDARNHEEEEATKALYEIEKLDVDSTEFLSRIAELEQAVSNHAEHEEREEFPLVIAECDEDKRRTMGTKVKAAEKVAPTHPHPSAAGSPVAQYVLGPFASLLDRSRDALSGKH